MTDGHLDGQQIFFFLLANVPLEDLGFVTDKGGYYANLVEKDFDERVHTPSPQMVGTQLKVGGSAGKATAYMARYGQDRC